MSVFEQPTRPVLAEEFYFRLTVGRTKLQMEKFESYPEAHNLIYGSKFDLPYTIAELIRSRGNPYQDDERNVKGHYLLVATGRLNSQLVSAVTELPFDTSGPDSERISLVQRRRYQLGHAAFIRSVHLQVDRDENSLNEFRYDSSSPIVPVSLAEIIPEAAFLDDAPDSSAAARYKTEQHNRRCYEITQYIDTIASFIGPLASSTSKLTTD